MDLLALISDDEQRDRRWQAALNGVPLDDGRPRLHAQNRSHSHLEQMKARRLREGC